MVLLVCISIISQKKMDVKHKIEKTLKRKKVDTLLKNQQMKQKNIRLVDLSYGASINMSDKTKERIFT